MFKSESIRRACGIRVQVWQGKSGRRYVHTVYPPEACPDLGDAIYLAVRRGPTGTRKPFAIDTTFSSPPDGPDRCHRLRDLQADEIHVHMLGAGHGTADRIIEDLQAQFEPA
ncbi:MAG: hypothetical protein ACR2PM_05060 [Hyphomicrobiales bacterium]